MSAFVLYKPTRVHPQANLSAQHGKKVEARLLVDVGKLQYRLVQTCDWERNDEND